MLQTLHHRQKGLRRQGKLGDIVWFGGFARGHPAQQTSIVRTVVVVADSDAVQLFTPATRPGLRAPASRRRKQEGR